MAEKIRFGKKKTIILVSLLLLLIGLVVGLILLLSGKDKNFDVNYSSTVAMDVSAKFEHGGKEYQLDPISFDPDDGEEQRRFLDFGDITLTSTSLSVTFTYVFENKDDCECIIKLYDNTSSDNIIVSYSVYIEGQLISGDLEEGITLSAGQVCRVMQYVRVGDDTKDAYYISSNTSDGTSMYWHIYEVEKSAGDR